MDEGLFMSPTFNRLIPYDPVTSITMVNTRTDIGHSAMSNIIHAKKTEKMPSSSSDQISDGNGEPERSTTDETIKYLRGWPLAAVSAILSLAILLVTIEVSIVATSLVSIADDLHAFNMTSWIVTAYLLTYTGFLIIFAKLSDVFGRKTIVISCLSLFTIFSGACGASQNMTQLIILRAFQGIGASGSYSVIVAIFFELVPPIKFARTTSLISSVFALAFLLGPLLGGAITQLSTWRWVFLLNVPAGSICVLGLAIFLPNNFPHHNRPACQAAKFRQIFSKAQLSRLDLIGTTLLLCASVLLVTGLEQAGNPYPWGSPLIVTCLVLCGIFWVCFFAWSKFATSSESVREPVLPWRLLQNRFAVGMLLSIFLTGMPFTVAVIQIPLRFQAVNALSPLQAGIRFLPYAVLNPLGSIIAPYAAKRFQIPPLYIMFGGAIFQVVGTGLLFTAPKSLSIPAETYIYEGLAGFGTGVNLACLIVMTPFNVEKRDKAVAMSAMVQSRMLGGALGLAIVTTALTTSVRFNLASASFTPTEIGSLLKNSQAFAELQSGRAVFARAAFASSYNLQMKIATGYSAAQILAALLLWKKKQFTIPHP